MKIILFVLLAFTFLAIGRAEDHDYFKVFKLMEEMDLNNVAYQTAQEFKRGIKEFDWDVIIREEQNRFSERDGCAAALGALGALIGGNGTCAQLLANPLTLTQSSVASYCTNCQYQVTQALLNVGSNCLAPSRKAAVVFLTAVFYNNFICTHDNNGVYCVPSFVTTVTSLGSFNFQTVTTSQLNQVCTNCTAIAVKALSSIGLININSALAAASLLRALCFQLNGQYCTISVQQSLTNAGPALQAINTKTLPSQSQFTTLMQSVCNPCFAVFFTRFLYVNSIISPGVVSPEAVVASLASLCRQDGSGQYCIVDILENAPSAILAAFSGNPCANITATTCPSGCQSLIANLISQVGCCWGLAADLSGINTTAAMAHFAPCFTASETQSGIPKICPSYSSATVTVTYSNCANSYFQVSGNAQTFLAAVASDFGNSLAVSFCNGVVTPSKKRDGTVTVTGTLIGPAANANALQSTDIICDVVCQNVDAALNASQPLCLQSSQTSNVNYVSSAPFLALCSLLLLASLLLSLF